MQIKKRLQINVAVSLLTTIAICLVLFLSLYRLNRANSSAKIAGEIVTSALEMVTLRNDFMLNNNVRAKEQWLAKHAEVVAFLKSTLEHAQDAEDRRNIAWFIEDQESIERIFTAIVANREKSGSNSGSAGISREIEGRLLSQLNIRVYEKVINGRKGLESSGKARSFALRLVAWGVFSSLLILIAAAIINSWTMSRSISDRVGRLLDGASLIGGGDLDHRIDIKGDDEFTELSNAFNTMSAKLSGSYHDLEIEIIERKRAEGEILRLNENLEQRVMERTTDLERRNHELEVMNKAFVGRELKMVELKKRIAELEKAGN